jgi:adenine-specific DNA-methyltransferase
VAVFLRSACNRLVDLGGNPQYQVFGVEIDPGVHRIIVDKLRDEFAVTDENFVLKDFFDYEPLPVNRVTVLVGNPPFIRYQRFRSEPRMRALAQAADHGVRLTQLSSSWAPFVVHSVSMVETGDVAQGNQSMMLQPE